ncbi:hypothetical protein AVEN_36156-1 [Araneus ventricosus]|uniref:Uncharacterized protein n=1 Tax=Araneus ventricosus TaxID=182803 RepID=A0A4Y2EJV1_ARAVE|nr:hypothetical protein AVEN_36156-1 [Araneus ventricosus]
MKEFSVFVLLMLTCLSESKPLQRVRRTIVKDYFNPLTYPTDKLQFEKGEDGKYHEQKHADSITSRVEYAVEHGIDASNEIFGEALESSEKTLKTTEDTVFPNTDNPGLSPVSSGAPKFELQKESVDLSTEVLTPGELETEVKEKVLIPETTAKLDSEAKSEDTASEGHGSSAKLDIPIDSKWSLVPKPDGKDDKPYEGGEEYLPEPPIAPEEREDEGKVEIGQIPKHHPFFVPPNIPLLIPKRISFRVLSLLPKPPAIHISDRLPLPEHEVIEESSETAVVENMSPSGPMLVKEGRRFVANHLINPLRIGLQLPFFPAANVLKEAVDEEKLKGLAKSEIVDIGGHKMLLQRKVLMSPHHDPSHMHISVMSIQPLEDVNPEILKELDGEKKELESEDEQLEKDLKLDEKKEAEKRSLEDDEVDSAVKEEGERGTEVFPKLLPQPEILDAMEPEVIEEKAIGAKIPPPEVHAVEMEEEDSEKEEKEDAATKEFELEAKIKDEDAEKAKESRAEEEFGLKTEIQAESKLEGDVEKNKGLEILPIFPEEKKEKEKTTIMVKEEKDISIIPEEEKEEEKTIAVAEEEKDLLIGTEDLKFRSQMKTHNPTGAEIGVDLTKGEFGFDKESQTKDEEVAESKSVEVKLKPEEESKYNLEKAITEWKKGDGGMLNAEEVAASHSGTEFTGSKDTKGKSDILKVEAEDLEKVVIEGKKDDEEKLSTEEAVAPHSVTEIAMSKDAKDKTDIMKTESKEFHEDSKMEGKKGDDEMLSSKEAAESHVATEIIASKEAKEKTDIRNLQHSEESSSKTEDFGLTKTEGAILEKR